MEFGLLSGLSTGAGSLVGATSLILFLWAASPRFSAPRAAEGLGKDARKEAMA